MEHGESGLLALKLFCSMANDKGDDQFVLLRLPEYWVFYM